MQTFKDTKLELKQTFKDTKLELMQTFKALIKSTSHK